MQVQELIRRATVKFGTQAELARHLNVPPQHISEWKNGKRTCTPEQRADLAIAAGVDPTAELIEGVLEGTAGTPRGERLKRALKKAVASVAKKLKRR